MGRLQDLQNEFPEIEVDLEDMDEEFGKDDDKFAEAAQAIA